MPRRNFQCDPLNPYHLWARSNNRDWFALPVSVVWEVMCDYLTFLNRAYNVRIHSFVLMNNHFHLFATFPEGNLSEALNYFMRETSRVIGYESHRINHVYGARIGRSRVAGSHNFMNVYKYVYRNPAEAGLCWRVEDYPYSTLTAKLGGAPLKIPVEDDSLIFDGDLERVLEWLNTKPEAEAWQAMSKALRRPDFRLSPLRSTRRPHPLESALL